MRRESKEMWKSLTEWKTIVFHKWWDMINIPLTLIPVVVGAILIVNWASGAKPPLPSWYVYMFSGGILLFVVVSFLAFHRIRQERDALLNDSVSSNEFDVKLREMRLRVRNSKVAGIPDLLLALRKEVESIGEGLKQKRVDPKILGGITTDTLDLKSNSPLLFAQYEPKSIRMIQAKMGLTKRNRKKEIFWQLRMAENIDNSGIGISNFLTKDFNTSKDQLSDIVTSDTTLHDNIDAYLDRLKSLHNLKLYANYSKNTDDAQVKSYFALPSTVGLLRNMEIRVEREVRNSFSKVLVELEKYQTGEAIKGEREL